MIRVLNFELVTKNRASAEVTVTTSVVARNLPLLSPIEIVDCVGVTFIGIMQLIKLRGIFLNLKISGFFFTLVTRP